VQEVRVLVRVLIGKAIYDYSRIGRKEERESYCCLICAALAMPILTNFGVCFVFIKL
jgi:hypothetical protein